MRAVVIVIVLPSADLLPGLAEGREQRLVQQLVPEPPVEALDEAPRHGSRTSGGHMARCIGFPGAM